MKNQEIKVEKDKKNNDIQAIINSEELSKEEFFSEDEETLLQEGENDLKEVNVSEEIPILITKNVKDKFPQKLTGEETKDMAIQENPVKEVAQNNSKEKLAKHEEEIIAYESAIKQAEENAIKISLVNNIFKLIGEGNARIEKMEEKGILLLGRTGAGKSTLTYFLAGQKLKGILDEDTGDMRVDAVKPLENIKISHNVTSETKVPNKFKVGDTVLWDCPGFKDTGGIVQETANSFYIKRLFETTKQIKLVLVISEASFGNKAADLIAIVDQFAHGILDIKVLENSISLVVTGVPENKKAIHIKNSINKIINENLNIIDNSPVKEVLQFLLKSVHIFHKPKEEGIILDSNLLQEIEDSTEYIRSSPDLANITISKESLNFTETLLEAAYENFHNIVNIIIQAIEEPTKCMMNNEENIFIKFYGVIKDLLPTSLQYANLNRLPKHHENEYFLNLDQIYSLQKTIRSLAGSQEPTKINNSFLNILDIFEEFMVGNNNLKQKIQEYAHIFKQQLEYIRFLSLLCQKENINYNHISDSIFKCVNIIDKAFEDGVKSIKLEPYHNDRAYYSKAIVYLNKYSDSQYCIKLKAEAFYFLGNICELEQEYNNALLNYAQSIKLNSQLPYIHEKMGDLLFKIQEYKLAKECYMVIENSIKIEDCFKELIKAHPHEPLIRIMKGDYFYSIGRFDKALGCYNDAYSVSKDDECKFLIKQKKMSIFNDQLEKTKEIIESLKTPALYNYSSFDAEKFLLAIIERVNQDEIRNENESIISQMIGETYVNFDVHAS